MNKNDDIFARRLKNTLSISLVERGELARHLGVSVPTVNRWLNGISTPNVYQFREIAHCFGMPYEWFVGEEDSIPDDLAMKLGLSPETVEAMMELAGDGNEDMLDHLDDAVYSIVSAVSVVQEELEQARSLDIPSVPRFASER